MKTPKETINTAFLKQKPSRNEIDNFKTNLIYMLDAINESEREELKIVEGEN